MDKKNTLIGATLLIAALALFLLAPRSAPPTRPGNVQPATSTAAPAASGTAAETPATNAATIRREAPGATVTMLANDFIEARFTDSGGALLEVAFKKYPAIEGRPEPYVFNHLHEDAILALTEYPGLGATTRYQLVSSSPSEVVYRTVVDGKVEVTRRYRLTADGETGADPYRLRHETTFRNLTSENLPLAPRAALGLGTATLLNANDTGQYLTVVRYDGDSSSFVARSDLEGGGIGVLVGAGRQPKDVLEQTGPVVWGAVKNQFFTSVYTPDEPGVSLVVKKLDLTRESPFPNGRNNTALTGAARFALPALGPNGTAQLAGFVYVGPQEYRRLSKFKHDVDKLLPYTQYFFSRMFLSGYVAPLLNTLLNLTHDWVRNWGVAVVLMTLILKIVSLPFTLAASKSAKRMAKLQPLMQEIREKYKDHPQKQQQATMELFKTHKVNPLGGCIPVLITMPLFIGFFSMLQCTAELRFAPFLWTRDLSAPDTVAYILGIPLNIMPLLMGATMFVQMKLTPTPSVDNMQAKMMKFMPAVITAICYNFSCALALYSTVNGLFTIGQQLIINRMKDDPGPVGPGTAAAFGKGMRNVTPKRKK